MEQEKKDRATNEGKEERLTEQPQHPGSVAVHGATVEPHITETNSSEGNPSRMIMTGVMTAAILAVIAVMVAGVFQLTSRWLIVCPQDLPVNDPAPVLWKQLTSAETNPVSLGVPQALVVEARFKGEIPTPAPGKEKEK